ncbi:MAG TPA: PEP-CTERM sorting domain-containing protein [Bryobacteraceae bacterium]|nr:PEP-CTERM sorting domain-containing protein [Bryobacteraceae bacterium]
MNVTLTDLEINPNDVGQLLSGLSFTLSNGATAGTLFSSTATQITVNSGGTYSLANSPGPAGWGLNNNVSGGLQLDALGFIGPAGLIIGPPGAGGTYSNANSSIAGNPAHNPFLSKSVTFIIDIAGVTSATTVTSATFAFGTTPGQFLVKGCVSTDPSCGLSQVPEPVSLVLTGSGLIGLLFLRRRRA